MDNSAKQKNGLKLKVKTLQRSYLHMMSQHECPQSLKVIFWLWVGAVIHQALIHSLDKASVCNIFSCKSLAQIESLGWERACLEIAMLSLLNVDRAPRITPSPRFSSICILKFSFLLVHDSHCHHSDFEIDNTSIIVFEPTTANGTRFLIHASSVFPWKKSDQFLCDWLHNEVKSCVLQMIRYYKLEIHTPISMLHES